MNGKKDKKVSVGMKVQTNIKAGGCDGTYNDGCHPGYKVDAAGRKCVRC